MSLRQPGSVIRRFPFTLLMLITLGVGAIITATPVSSLSNYWLHRLGFAPPDLLHFRWERLITSALITSGGLIFWQAMGMITMAVGAAEWLTGTRRTVLTFWGVHLVTLVGESLLIALPLHQLWVAQGVAVMSARDVGPSAGYFGCLGLACSRLPQPWRWLSGSAVLVGLIITLFTVARPGENWTVKLFADLAHLIAFPLGWLTAGLKMDEVSSVPEILASNDARQ